jgi:hypothetical protein
MLSCGHPHNDAVIQWIRDPVPYRNRPVFIGNPPCNNMILKYEKTWVILIDNVLSYSSQSFGLHPITVLQGEWFFHGNNSTTQSNIYFYMNWYGSCSQPLDLENDVGLDVFVRLRLPKPIWYINPVTHEKVHSGAKYLNGKLGRRYCWICNCSVSANNFVSQHLKQVHRPVDVCYNVLDVVNCIISI